MSNKVRVKRSAVAGKVPATTDIDLGELAVNTYDGKLFIKKSVSGVESIVEIGSGSGGGGGTAISISDTAPTSPTAGALWWDSTIGQLRIYYNDGTSSQWVDAFNSQGLQGAQGPQGPQGPQGITGAQGVAGADGNTILYGTSNPTTQGVIDDFYLNTTTYTLFGPKTVSGWGTGVSLLGSINIEDINNLDVRNGLTDLYPLRHVISNPSGTTGPFFGYINNGPTVLSVAAAGNTPFITYSSFFPSLSNPATSTKNTIIAGDLVFFAAMGDDAIPNAPVGDQNGTAVTTSSGSQNTVYYRYGYILQDSAADSTFSGLSTAAVYNFYVIRGADITTPVLAHTISSGTTGVPSGATLNVTKPGCLILSFGAIDDDIVNFWTSPDYPYMPGSIASYGSAEAGGTLVSQHKASFEIGNETPPSFVVDSNDAWVSITVAIQPFLDVLPNPIPAGGTTGQVLQKVSGTNYAVEWATLASGGGVVSIKETAYASGSGTFTPDPKALFTEVICTGGGGGGGGVDWTSGFAAGGGGGAGGTSIAWFTPEQMGSSAAYAIGAAGTAGAASTGGNGGNGGSSTFNPAGTGNTLTGGGGTGGTGAGTTTNTQVGYIRTGGAGGTASGGDINREGQSGGHGIAFATTSMMGGNGGGSYWGNGGAGAVRSSSGATAGTSATSDGDGGGGAVNSNSTSGVAGGAGVSGKIFILEYLGA